MPNFLLPETRRTPSGAFRKKRAGTDAAGLAALVWLLVGLAAALVTLPADVAEPGAVRVPCLWVTAGLIAGVAARTIKQGVAGALRAESIMAVAMVYFILLDGIQGLYPLRVRAETLGLVFVAISLFMGAMLVVSMGGVPGIPRVLVRVAQHDYSPRHLKWAVTAAASIGLSYYFIKAGFSPARVMQGLQAGRFGAPWSRGALGGWDAFLDHLVYFGYLLPTLTVMLALRMRRWLSAPVLLSGSLALFSLSFLVQSGNRRLVAVPVAAATVTWILFERKRLRPRHLVVTACLGLAVLVVMDLMLANREHGLGRMEYSLDEFQGVRVDDNLLRFGQILEFIPHDHPHTGMQWLVFTLARPIPRVFWPGKPVNMGFDLAQTLGINASLTTSLIAEWYIAFGWFGVAAGGALYGLLTRWWSRLLDLPPTLASSALYGLGLMAIVLSVRSQLELILMSYPVLAFVVMNEVALRQSQKRRERAIAPAVRVPAAAVDASSRGWHRRQVRARTL